MSHRERSLATLILLCLLAWVGLFWKTPIAGANAVTIYDSQTGEGPAPIVFAEGDPKDHLEVGKRLLPILDKMTGAHFSTETLKPDAPVPSPAIVISIDAAGFESKEAFTIRTEDNRVILKGGSIVAIKYAMYEMLERLGCRFWSYNEESIPTTTVLKMPALDFKWEPAFRIHDIMSKEAQTYENDFHYKSRAASILKFTGNHSLYPLLTPYAEKNRHFYPLLISKDSSGKILKEERRPNDLHFCYMADGISEALAEALSVEVEKRKGNVKDYIYFAGMGDAINGQCWCETCKKIYEDETWTNAGGAKHPGYSATLLRMINSTAELLEKKYPGIMVGTFAYMTLEAPPAMTRPRENVVVYVPRLRHCGVHAVDDCGRNGNYWQSLNRWCELAPGRVYVWEYGANFTNFLYPFPVLNSMSRNIQAYLKAGVAGLVIQRNYVTHGGDMAVTNNYVWSRLMYDPNLDAKKLLTEFLTGYYGPAAQSVQRYIEEVEASVNGEPRIHADEFSEPLKSYLSESLMTRLDSILGEARKAAAGPGNEEYLRRVEEMAIGVDAARFFKSGDLVERDGRYIRADFGYDTLPRALELMKYSRGSTRSEHAQGRRHWLMFLSTHGGPMATLRGPSITAKVFPAEMGKIGPVTYEGVRLLSSSRITSMPFGEFDGEPTAEQAEIVGESGIGAWSPTTKHKLRMRVRATTDNSILLDGQITRVSREEKYSTTSITLRTAYPIKQQAAPLTVSWKGANGEWTIKELPNPLVKPVKFEAVNGWRIAFPKASVTDVYQIEGGPPVLSGEVGIDPVTKEIYTEVVVLTENVEVGVPVPFFHRKISFETH